MAFWDALKTLEEGASRRAGSLARLMAHLVIRKQLSLTVLKVRDVDEMLTRDSDRRGCRCRTPFVLFWFRVHATRTA